MKIRSFSPGDHVAKLDWDNRPLLVGIVTASGPVSDRVHVLSSIGHTWEYTHDLVPVSEVPGGKK